MDAHNEESAPPAEAQEQQQQQHENGVEGPTEQTGTDQPAQVSDEEIKQRLLVHLSQSDLTQTTEKMLRKLLEKELGQDLSSRKGLIREQVLAYLEQQQPAEEEEAAEEEEEEEQPAKQPAKPKRGQGAFGGDLLLSPALQQFLGVDRLSRSQVVKGIWDYIKANDLQDPRDRKKIIVDEKMATIFKPPITMFSMNKQLSKHLSKPGEVQGAQSEFSDNDDDDDDEEAPKPPRKRAKTKAAGPQGFAKPVPLSDELAAVCGKAQMNRGELQKWIFTYADQHNLKDPADKRYALCDEALQQLTGQTRILLFGAQKFLKKHIDVAK